MPDENQITYPTVTVFVVLFPVWGPHKVFQGVTASQKSLNNKSALTNTNY